MEPDKVTLINLLPSCAEIGAILQAKSIHAFSMRKGFLCHPALETALLSVYGKCGETKLAECFFSQMRERTLISWNAIIAAYVQNGQHKKALEVFQSLWDEHHKPDAMTVTGILHAYGEMASLKEGKQIHGYIIKLDLCLNTFVTNSLIYMYAKCGDLWTARDIFDRMPCKDVISWNAIIMAYAIHGFAKDSLKLFSKMLEEGLRPNASTFVSLLSACSMAGMVKGGWEYFNSMKRDYGIDPGIEHYGCMLDLLGRAGDLNVAKQFVEQMPLVPTARIWGSLLAASRHHQNLELAELAANQVLALEDDNTGCYVLLSNMYANAGRWEDVGRIRSLMNEKGFAKTIGSTAMEVRGKTYRFTDQDRSQMETNLIYVVLGIISRKIGEDLFVGVSKLKPVSRCETGYLFWVDLHFNWEPSSC